MLNLYLWPSIITVHSTHMEEVTIIPSVGVDTTNSISNSRTNNLSFLAQSKDIKELVAPESKNTDNYVPRIEQIPLTKLSDCEASAPLIAKTLPATLVFFLLFCCTPVIFGTRSLARQSFVA